jgi:predicted dinucleotide-binding enzyme
MTDREALRKIATIVINWGNAVAEYNAEENSGAISPEEYAQAVAITGTVAGKALAKVFIKLDVERLEDLDAKA